MADFSEQRATQAVSSILHSSGENIFCNCERRSTMKNGKSIAGIRQRRILVISSIYAYILSRNFLEA